MGNVLMNSLFLQKSSPCLSPASGDDPPSGSDFPRQPVRFPGVWGVCIHLCISGAPALKWPRPHVGTDADTGRVGPWPAPAPPRGPPGLPGLHGAPPPWSVQGFCSRKQCWREYPEKFTCLYLLYVSEYYIKTLIIEYLKIKENPK